MNAVKSSKLFGTGRNVQNIYGQRRHVTKSLPVRNDALELIRKVSVTGVPEKQTLGRETPHGNYRLLKCDQRHFLAERHSYSTC
jgi:hypothetical protein